MRLNEVNHARSRNRIPLTQPAVVHIRRSYSDSRLGQLHVTAAYPSGGGFDERTPLLCIHHAAGSGRWFAPMLRDLGRERSIYAPDLPGHGQSDAGNGKATVTELANALGDFIDSLRLRQFDVFGYQIGALAAAELAIARPQQVRRILMWGLPAQSPQDRGALAQGAISFVREDGSDVVDAWRRAVDSLVEPISMQALADEFADRLRAGPHGVAATSALIEYPLTQRFPLVKQQTLILRPRDEFWDHAPRARTLLPQGSVIDLPEHGRHWLATAPQRFAAIAREFLDR
jgi:pimeloyl-ACP methyl ester carboxylesterase